MVNLIIKISFVVLSKFIGLLFLYLNYIITIIYQKCLKNTYKTKI